MVGTTISHYLVLEELGRGGMGIVYRALDKRLDREVALKILPSQQLAIEQERARLFSEAHAAAQLNHPGIATVHEIDDHEGIAFIVMELVPGEDLSARMFNGRMPAELDNGWLTVPFYLRALYVRAGVETIMDAKDLGNR